MSVDIGVVRVLPPDHPMMPEMVARVPGSRECPADIRLGDAPEVLRPLAEGTPWGGFWCTRTAHQEGTPHACALHPEDGLGEAIALIVWGGE